MQQLGNVGAEIGRTISWKQNPIFGNSLDCFYRGLNLLDLTINDPKNAGARIRELCRVREALVDWHYGSRLYGTTDLSWTKYFDSFAIAANNR